MHELPVTQSLLDMVVAKAEEAGASRVTEIHLTIGELSSFIDDSITFYWDILSRDTIADGASIHFKRIAVRMHCLDCDDSYQPESGELLCPECNGAQVKVIAGDEFQLEYIVVDENQTENADLEKIN